MEANTPKVSERTAHLFNALRLLEEFNKEVYNAFTPFGEEVAGEKLSCFDSQYTHARDTILDWIGEAAFGWAISEPAAAEF